ncbi:MAG: glutamine--fructose-6-phosphate aminotransferase [Candidatus Levybacteria bacterium RIFCSPHIGHO2_01_FULL_42_15]|nr:MAG: glutamine--fructose-6-phosphate aminotransferase [Candidatus Levybacteria bacterium RIFCSPHIGHO2_01_FULL_42_15]OGH42895.1 MAG: glutamine--fructose-6-phosphate aminotransferase [Candidatus Levybacteria bacterium RIFCSPLOWO2_01_FULL_42_15]
MCGIFGYVGKQNNAAQIVLEGLRLLEYRGYDSWGIAVKSGKKLMVNKQVGKIESAKTTLSASFLGIGHTRWATHGGVTENNAHPHLDCKQEIALVHNGIVENFVALKEELIIRGHSFNSETDTEVIVHLIEEYLKKEGFASSVRDSFNRLKGLNAIVVAYAVSRQIIACKTGSSLVVGQKNSDFYIASDALGITDHTKKLFFLKDGEMVILGEKLQLISIANGKKLKANFETIHWKQEDSKIGNFNHFMEKEIYEQPRVVRTIARTADQDIISLSRTIKRARGTFFIGAGTAFHACLAGTYLFSGIAKIHVNTAVASEFNYLEDFLTKESLIIALSQSGETIDVLEPLNRAKGKGSRIVALTNVLGSSLYRLADHSLILGAGVEKAVASTKAYTAKLALLLMLAHAMNGEIKKAKKNLLETSKEIQRLLSAPSRKNIRKIALVLKSSEHIYTIGRGVSYPTALEAALKIKEVSYIHTEGLAGGELKHGTLALVEKGTPCIVFAPNDDTYEAMISNAIEIKSRGGVIIGISTKKSSVFDYFIEVRDMGWARIIAQIIPAQLLAYYLAVERGCDPDKPRNLAKSVTVK